MSTIKERNDLAKAERLAELVMKKHALLKEIDTLPIRLHDQFIAAATTIQIEINKVSK